MTQPTSRRLKVVSVPTHQVLDLFAFAVQGYPPTVHLPIIDGLPDGTRVGAVNFDFHTNSFLFLVENDAFDEVPEGERIPQFNNSWKVRFITVGGADGDSPAIVQMTL